MQGRDTVSSGSAKALDEVLAHLRDDTGKWQDFAPLKNSLSELARADVDEDGDDDDDAGHRSRAPRSFVTTQALRTLVPGKCLLSKIYIVHQRSAQEFRGYYLGGVPTSSTGRTWGGPVTRQNGTRGRATGGHMDMGAACTPSGTNG